ncbi:MAG: glycosyltransferase family 2 protein [Gammaproteobacteria bacterium]|nr:glycosyltransferase family 2 protein [Gammaproteobacteria bacterium]
MISIVVPACNEADNIAELHARLRAVLAPLPDRWELVFIDDGSRDATWARIVALAATDERVRGVRLSRTFGHQNALLAGLAAARGAAVISMDADLQHPPEVVPQLIARWREGNAIVHGVRRDPAFVTPWKKASSRLYYRLFSYLSGVDLQPGAADFRLLDRQVLNEILAFPEEGLFLRGLVHWIGYDTASVEFDCAERFAGRTAYTPRKMLSLAWHGISSFSLVPLRIAILIGLVSSTLAFFGTGYAILGKWLDHDVIPGWASTIVIVSLPFSALFAFLAILAEYVGRVAVEVRGRPRFIVRETTPAAAQDPPLRDAARGRPRDDRGVPRSPS